jgi:Fur family transcriptional regulator, ferric uptake regulator
MSERRTRQQEAVREALGRAGRPVSVQEVHDAASREVPTIGLSTVYRAIKRLADAGEIASVSVPGQPDRYELAEVAATHHHHFHCTGCDRVFDVRGCVGGLDRLLPSGFRLRAHELTLIGLCPACNGE